MKHNISDMKVKGRIVKSRQRDENAPKQPMSAYALFIKDQTTNKKVAAFKDVANAWREMDAEQRKPYTDMAVESRAQYEKEMEIYKKSDVYKEFIRKKKIKGDVDTGSDKLNGISIFSKPFLDYNRMREAELRKLRKEIGDVEEEAETVEKQIASLSTEVESTQEALHADESHLQQAERVLERWRRQTLRAMEEARLLAHFHLTTSSRTADLVERLEEASKKHDQFSNSLRTCLLSVNYG